MKDKGRDVCGMRYGDRVTGCLPMQSAFDFPSLKSGSVSVSVK